MSFVGALYAISAIGGPLIGGVLAGRHRPHLIKLYFADTIDLDKASWRYVRVSDALPH